MDVRQLQTLVAVAEHRTFSAAARALHTVQSNVSTHIARLEKELGVTLVDRSLGRLTAEGEVVVARARRVAAEMEALTSDVASMTSQVTGGVHLGMIGTTGRWLTPRVLDDLTARHPGVAPVIVEATTSTLMPQLLTGQIDLSVVNVPLRDPDLTVRPLFDEDLVAIVPTAHPLASNGPEVSLAELAEHELLLGPQGSILRDEVDAAAALAGVELAPWHRSTACDWCRRWPSRGTAPPSLPATAIPRWAGPAAWTRARHRRTPDPTGRPRAPPPRAALSTRRSDARCTGARRVRTRRRRTGRASDHVGLIRRARQGPGSVP